MSFPYLLVLVLLIEGTVSTLVDQPDERKAIVNCLGRPSASAPFPHETPIRILSIISMFQLMFSFVIAARMLWELSGRENHRHRLVHNSSTMKHMTRQGTCLEDFLWLQCVVIIASFISLALHALPLILSLRAP